MVRKIVFFAFVTTCLILSGISVAPAQEWSDAIELGSGDTPDMDIDPATGNVHVVVMNNGVIYNLLDRDGNILKQETVSNTAGEKGKFRFGATIAVDPEGRPHICYRTEVGTNLYDINYTFLGSAWVRPLKIAGSVFRGYSVRMDVDDDGDVHIVHGSVNNDIWGPATYYRIKDGKIVQVIENLTKYRGDDRVELSTYGNNSVRILLGSPDGSGNRRLSYYRSDDNGQTLNGPGNLRAEAANGRTGNPDMFIDKLGNTHVVYGVASDADRGGTHSVRYHRRENGERVLDIPITDANELEWWHHDGLGIASVAASDDGYFVVIAYVTKDGGQLRTRISKDGGQTWSAPVSLASQAGGSEGRDKAIVRANGNRFYVAYQSGNRTWVRWFKAIGDPPVADAGGPYSGQEGQPILFDASASTDDIGIAEYAWDWDNDGIFDETTNLPTVQHTFPDDLAGSIGLRVTDGEGMADSTTVAVSVLNVNPTVAIQAEATGDEGTAMSFQAQVTDPGTDTHTITWTFGDGDSASGASVDHAFKDNGSFTVTAKATDDDGGVGSQVFPVTVRNVPPTAEAGGPYNAVRFEPLQIAGSGSDAGVNDVLTYAWDLDGDGTFESDGQQVSHTYVLLGTYTIHLRVQDNGGGEGIDSAQVVVGLGNPVLSNIPPQTTAEGTPFDPILLDNFVDDPNTPDNQILWSFFGNQNLIVQVQNRTATVVPADSEWAGTENITFIASDPQGLRDSTTTAFTVIPVNDPPSVSGIPNQQITEKETFAPISLNQYVRDPDNTDAELHWNVFGNINLGVSIENNIATITRVNPNWFGTEVLLFVAIDPLGASDSTLVNFSMTAVNDPPAIAEIPGQTIRENQAFAPIVLDDFVDDPDNADNELLWSIYGNRDLLVRIVNRIATVTPPDSEWAGVEIIHFAAKDPGGQADTAAVRFEIIGFNDPPRLINVTDYSIDEDDTLAFSAEQLANMAFDPDDPIDRLEFTLAGATYLRLQDNPAGGIWILPQADWSGVERVWLKVSDGENADSARTRINVLPVDDAPKAFSLISPVGVFYTSPPDTLTFKWQSTYDPDAGDEVTYTWQLSSKETFSDTLIQQKGLIDTTVVIFTGGGFLPGGSFYWRVIATSTGGQSTFSRNNGVFSFLTTGIDDDARIPSDLSLYQNYPNPFNPETRISYDLPQAGAVTLTVYNSLGNAVRQLVSGHQGAGRHKVTWDARDDAGRKVASGIYIYKLQAGKKIVTRKMLLLQ